MSYRLTPPNMTSAFRAALSRRRRPLALALLTASTLVLPMEMVGRERTQLLGDPERYEAQEWAGWRFSVKPLGSIIRPSGRHHFRVICKPRGISLTPCDPSKSYEHSEYKWFLWFSWKRRLPDGPCKLDEDNTLRLSWLPRRSGRVA